MTVTRDVIYDLLPGYFAGELSGDSKALVDEYFATDPEFARMAERFRTLFSERRTDAAHAPAARERAVFERARTVRTVRDRAYGLAVAFTICSVLALFFGALIPSDPSTGLGIGFMRVGPFAIWTVVGIAAIVAWVVWLLSGRTARR